MTEATYRPVKPDGAGFRCVACGALGDARLVWFITTPDKKNQGVHCKQCVDDDWIRRARFIPDPI